MASLLTLLTNTPNEIKPLSATLPELGKCDGAYALTVSCAFDAGDYTWMSHLYLVVAFGLVASGFLPAVTGPLHLYAIVSFQNVLTTADGGEHVSIAFAFLALPICLVDPRLSHWRPWPSRATGTPMDSLRRSTATVFQTMIRAQVSFVYFVSAVAKFGVPEWADGTALYYWVTAPYLSSVPFINSFLEGALRVPFVLLICTYGPIVLELAIAAGILLPTRARRILLIFGIGFHITIGIIFSIWTFALVMCAMLMVVFGPVNVPLRRLLRRSRTIADAESLFKIEGSI